MSVLKLTSLVNMSSSLMRCPIYVVASSSSSVVMGPTGLVLRGVGLNFPDWGGPVSFYVVFLGGLVG